MVENTSTILIQSVLVLPLLEARYGTRTALKATALTAVPGTPHWGAFYAALLLPKSVLATSGAKAESLRPVSTLTIDSASINSDDRHLPCLGARPGAFRYLLLTAQMCSLFLKPLSSSQISSSPLIISTMLWTKRI